jgi:hypothetical protein
MTLQQLEYILAVDRTGTFYGLQKNAGVTAHPECIN